jgi:catechol 2,3-dioxygenase-like lactoylglutathione lyase family enzyme
MDRPDFRGGSNIAMKVPSHRFDATVAFYEDVLGLARVAGHETPVFAFGAATLWIDLVPHLSQTEVWLEVECEDVEGADAWLREQGVAREDALEPLPEGFRGFWIVAPPDVVHLVSEPGQ